MKKQLKQNIYLFLKSAIAGFLVFGPCVFSFYDFFFYLVPAAVSTVMGLLLKGKKESVVFIPALNLVYCLIFLKPVNYKNFIIADILNIRKVNHLLSLRMDSLTAVYLLFFLISMATALAIHAAHKGEGEKTAKNRKWISYILLSLVVLNLILQSAFFNPAFFKACAADSERQILLNDNSSYLRIYFMECQGYHHYTAYFMTFNFSRDFGGLAPNYYLGYRLPGFFMMLKFLTFCQGILIPVYFIVFSAIAVIAVFLIGKKFMTYPEVLVGAFLISPFFAYGIPSWHMLMMEYWSLFFMLISLCFYVYEKDAPAVLFMSLAAICRIPFIAPCFLLIAASLFSDKKRNLYLLAIPAVVSVITLASHVLILHLYFRDVVPRGLLTGYRGEGWLFIKKVFEFASPFYAGWHFLIIAVAVLAFISLFFLRRDLQVFLGGYLFIFLIFFYLKGNGLRNYWGIFTTPVMMFTAGFYPLALNKLFKTKPARREA